MNTLRAIALVIGLAVFFAFCTLALLLIIAGCTPGANVKPQGSPPPSKCQVVRSDGTSYDCPPWILQRVPVQPSIISRMPR